MASREQIVPDIDRVGAMANLSGWAQEPLERVDARTTLSGWAQGPLVRVGARTTSAFDHVGAAAGVDRTTPAGIARSLEMQRYGLCNDQPLATLSGEGAGLERPACCGRAMPNGPLAAAADNVTIGGVLPQPARGPCTCGWRGEARRLS